MGSVVCLDQGYRWDTLEADNERSPVIPVRSLPHQDL